MACGRRSGGAQASCGVGAGAPGRTLPFVRHRQVGASLCGLIADSYPQSRAGRPPFSDGDRAPLNVALRERNGRLGLRCNAVECANDCATANAFESHGSARPLRRHVRPVLKHGPRCLTCERAIEIDKSQTRNESEVSSDGTSGDPAPRVAPAQPRAAPWAGLLFGALLRRGPRAHTLGPERW